MSDQILDAKEVAERLKVTPNYLAKMRMDGTSPAYFRVGRKIRYYWSDVQAWIDSNRAESTDDYAA